MDNNTSEPKSLDDGTTNSTRNNDGDSLALNMNRLSLSTAMETPLPPSSPIVPSMKTPDGKRTSTAGLNASSRTPLRRTPSTTSMGNSERTSTPTLHKRASLTSLQSNGGTTPSRSPAIRRTSSHFSSSNMNIAAKSSLPPPTEEPRRSPVTAASVARDFFEKELSAQEAGIGVGEEPQAVIILQDDCYGHRFSRPRTSRANLSTVVERPERIHATILGLATAYVRLGARHAGGSAAPHPMTDQSQLQPAPFHIRKTARRLPLRSPAASAIHGVQWMGELAAMCDAAESKLALGGKELTRPNAPAHSNSNGNSEKPRLHEGDLYLCSGSLNALEGALGGVCEGVDAVFNALGPKRAFVCIRPPGHHCSADTPSGFCWLNNVHVGIGHAVLSHGLTHAAIIDFDLHHGDGSQSIAWAHNSRVASLPKNTPLSKKPAIGYFSLHDINSYPCEEGDDEKVRNASLCIENAHGQTIWNVHLQPWKTEADFWRLYENKYSVIIKKARSFLRLHSEKLRQAPTHPRPKGAIFLSTGFDASEWESPGMQRHQVNVPTSFYARLTTDVVAMAGEEGLGVDGRVISVLEGGYSDRALMSGVLSHLCGLTGPARPTMDVDLGNEVGSELNPRLGDLDLSGDLTNGRIPNHDALDPDWWSLHRLEDLENVVNPTVAPFPKKQRNETRPTYTSATQSFTAKIVSPPQGRRSFPGATVNNYQSARPRSPSPPPPPAVDWATAAHELSKLLIPSNRETRSCKPEDLNAEASRARRDRYSSIGDPSPPEASARPPNPKRMQLRDRRGKVPQYVSEDEDEKPPSRANRRKTIADVSLLNENTGSATQGSLLSKGVIPTKHTRRRSSIASNASSLNAERGSDFSISSTTDAHPKRQPLVVKKPRASANPRPESTKPKMNKKQPPVPRFPSQSSTLPIPENLPAPAAATQEDTKAPLSVKENSTNSNVDQLASDMRTMSIKLKVPPKEEYEARQSKPKPAPRGRPSKPTIPKVTSPAKAKSRVVKESLAEESLPAEHPAAQQLPHPPAVCDGSMQEDEVAPPTTIELPSQRVASETPRNTLDLINSTNSSTDSAPRTSADISNTTIPTFHRDGNKQADISLTETQTYVAPAEESPYMAAPATPTSARRTKQDFPVFTSTSLISFEGRPTTFSSIDQNKNQDHPNTSNTLPDTVPPSSIDYPTTTKGFPVRDLPPENQQTHHYPVKEITSGPPSSTSIWDVPDTPGPRKA